MGSMSHYWQVPSFNRREMTLGQDGKEVKKALYDSIQFQKDVLNTMSNGVRMGEEKGFCSGISRVDYFIRDDADTQAVIFSPGLHFAEGFLYKERVESMEKQVRKLFPRANVRTETYLNMGKADPKIEDPTSVTDIKWSLGKILVQYDPDNGLETSRNPKTGVKCNFVQAGIQIISGDDPSQAVMRNT